MTLAIALTGWIAVARYARRARRAALERQYIDLQQEHHRRVGRWWTAPTTPETKA